MNDIVILVAEDDADDKFLLKSAFDELGFPEKLEFVENGVEVIQYLDNLGDKSFNGFILLDLNMPKKDGREVLKHVKNHPKFKKIPVIVFSTTKNEIEVMRCYDLGANTYIIKPSSYDALLKFVKELHSYWTQLASLAN